MEKEVMGKEKEEVGGAGRLVRLSLCCLAGTGSNSLISKLCFICLYRSRRVRKKTSRFSEPGSFVSLQSYLSPKNWLKNILKYTTTSGMQSCAVFQDKTTVRNNQFADKHQSRRPLPCNILLVKKTTYKIGKKHINIKLNLIFVAQENVRQSVRKRTVSKEELQSQFTW